MTIEIERPAEGGREVPIGGLAVSEYGRDSPLANTVLRQVGLNRSPTRWLQPWMVETLEVTPTELRS